MATSGAPQQQQPNTGGTGGLRISNGITSSLVCLIKENLPKPYEWPSDTAERRTVCEKLQKAGVHHKIKNYLVSVSKGADELSIDSLKAIGDWLPRLVQYELFDIFALSKGNVTDAHKMVQGLMIMACDDRLQTMSLASLFWMIKKWPERVPGMVVHDTDVCGVRRQEAAKQFVHLMACMAKQERETSPTQTGWTPLIKGLMQSQAFREDTQRRAHCALALAWYASPASSGITITADDADKASAAGMIERARDAYWRSNWFGGELENSFPSHLISRDQCDVEALVKLAHVGRLSSATSGTEALNALADKLEGYMTHVREVCDDDHDRKLRLNRMQKAVRLLRQPRPKMRERFEQGLRVATLVTTLPTAAPAPQVAAGAAPLALPPPSAPDLRAWLAKRVRPRRGCAKCEVARGPEDSVRTGFAKDGGTGKNSEPSKKRACPRFDHAISAQDGDALIAKYQSENGVKNIPNKKQKFVAFMKEEYNVEPLGQSPSYKVTLYDAPLEPVQVGVTPAADGNVALDLTVVGKKRLRPVDKDGEVYEGEDPNKIPRHDNMFMGFEIVEG